MLSTHLPKTPGIYSIINTANHHCYVGSTKNLQSRYRKHFRDLRVGKHVNPHLQHAYSFYGRHAFIFVVLEHVHDVFLLLTKEQHYIDILKPEYNILTSPGNGRLGIPHSEETRHKMSLAAKGRKFAPHTEEFKAHLRALNKGKTLTPEHREKISRAHKGKKMSREAVEKSRRANIGRKLSEEHRRKLSVVRKGEKHNFSEQGKANVLAANIGRELTPEHIAKRQATRKANREAGLHKSTVGRKFSSETRAKMSAAKRAYLEKKRLAKEQEDLKKFATPESSDVDLNVTNIAPRSLWDDLP